MSIEIDEAVNLVSIVSLWETAIKIRPGKLQLPFSEINLQIEKNGFEILPITFQDTLAVPNLSFLHRDPFDRILITQSITNKRTLILKDKVFSL